MSVFEDIIKVDENGNLSYTGWIEWKHISLGLMHCPVCLALDNCWFNSFLKPEIPQHDKCHCRALVISKPTPNVNSKATCDLKKFTEYIFSDKYAWNGKKDLFESLGFTINNSEYLKNEYENQAVKNYCNSKYSLGSLDSQGQRITIEINFVKNNKNIVFKSGWMVRPKGKITNNTPYAG